MCLMCMCEARTLAGMAPQSKLTGRVSCGAGEARKAVWAKQLELRGCAEELHVVTQESQAQQVRVIDRSVGRLDWLDWLVGWLCMDTASRR